LTKIHGNLTDLIGRTPLIELRNIVSRRSLGVRLLAKLEYLNPAGSVKDRSALGIIREAEASGRLKPGDMIVDITSGNTGIALAAIAATRGYRTKFYLRSTISRDKINILRQFGAEVVIIDNLEFLVPDAIETIIARIRAENPDAFFADQRDNPANPRIHYDMTGPEIWDDTGGEVDVVIGAVGTGGSLSGIGRYLKERKPGVRIVVSEPSIESLPSPEQPYAPGIEGVHKVTDIEPRLLPRNFDPGVVDKVVAVTADEADDHALVIAREEGILAGTSAGASLAVALTLAADPAAAGQTFVIIVCDSAERYLSIKR
jgi:cysteine synthase A